MRSLHSLAAAALFAATASALAQPLTTAFTYQGELKQSGSPATGTFDLQFKLFDAPSAGNQIGTTLCSNNVNIAAGCFTTVLDFGSVFNGQKRFLEVAVRADATGSTPCATATGYTTLAPRQELSAAPNATFALTAAAASTATTAALASDSSQLNGKVASYYLNASNLSTGTIPSGLLGGIYTASLTFSNPSNTFIGIGTGLTQLNASNLVGGTVSDSLLTPNIPRLNVPNIFTDTNKFSGIIHSTVSGYRFPDDSVQRSAALDPGRLGFSSGYPAGTTVAITIHNTSFPTARMVGSWRINRPTTGSAQWSIPPTLRRPRTSDNTWFSWVQSGTSLSGLRIAVMLSGGQYNYDFPTGRLSSYRLLTGDDGLPFEEITYITSTPNIPTNISQLQGSPTGVLEPGVAPRLGDATGIASTTYRTVWSSGRSDVVRVVGDPTFIVPIDPASGQQSGQIGSATVTIRANSLAASLNLDFAPQGRPFRLVLHPAAGTDIDLTNAVTGFLVSTSLRIADDGLPVEEYEVNFPFNPPP